MLDNVQQKTIKPVIESYVRKGSLVYSDEYRIYESARRSGCRLDT
jgi:transposase-like protein